MSVPLLVGGGDVDRVRPGVSGAMPTLAALAVLVAAATDMRAATKSIETTFIAIRCPVRATGTLTPGRISRAVAAETISSSMPVTCCISSATVA